MKKELIKLIATGFYSGYGRPFPGTWGTIPALLIAFFLIGDNQVILAAVAVLTFIVSVWTANEAEGFFGHDARRIVIDEWAGMFVTVLFVPYSPVNYIIAFILFRGFDVVKIPPAIQAERLPGGWGVTMDDIIAGAQANITTHLIISGLNWFGRS